MSLSCENTICTTAANFAAYQGDLEILETAITNAIIKVGINNVTNSSDTLNPDGGALALSGALNALASVQADLATLAGDLTALTADAANVCCCIQGTLTATPGSF
jgi:hypothetical protein